MNLLTEQIGSEDSSGEASMPMEHQEAVEMMATERYLLDELTPELRDAYEDHMFGCAECANDARFGAAFVDHAKVVMPGMAFAAAPVRKPVTQLPKLVQHRKAEAERRDWFAWLRPAIMRPAIMVPAFACLLALVGYQSFVIFPALEASASEPRILPAATVLAGETRGGVPVVHADPVAGSTLSIPLPQNANYAHYKFDLHDSKDQLIWTRDTASAAAADDMATIWLPGRIKQDAYKLAVIGVTASGEDIPISKQIFDLRTKK